MVVISSAVLNKTGRTLFARQFVDISRVRIEGLLAAFPKLLGEGGKQHTFIETESVRYVYQPVEALYVLLVTTKNSNIIEDLETLHLLVKQLPEYSAGLEEESIAAAAFDLMFAFDEVVSIGYREQITSAQIRTNLQCESHAWRVAQSVKASQEASAKAARRKKLQEIEQAKAMQSLGRGSSTTGFGRDSLIQGGGGAGYVEFTPSAGVSAQGVSSSPGPSSPGIQALSGPRGGTAAARAEPAGLVLGKAGQKKAVDFFQQLKMEGDDVGDDEARRAASASVATGAASALPAARVENIHLSVVEHLSIDWSKDGGLTSMEVKGEVSLMLQQGAETSLQIAVQLGDNQGFKFMTHPNIDKQRFAKESVLALKDASRAFPVATPLNVLKWLFATKDEAAVPFSINCWPTIAGGEAQVSVEYELTNPEFDLRDVVITIPCEQQATVTQIDGSCDYDAREHVLNWRLPIVDGSNATGAMEFTVPGSSEDAFFPVRVTFSSRNTFCKVAVGGVASSDGNPVSHSTETVLAVDNYSVS